jgi:hypothetical protein
MTGVIHADDLGHVPHSPRNRCLELIVRLV